MKKGGKGILGGIFNKSSDKNQKYVPKRLRDGKLDKLRTGIVGLDSMFSEGIPDGSSVLIEGGPGSGKTILCLQIVHYMCSKGKRCLYMSFEEPHQRLVEHMEDFGWKPKEYEKDGLLRLTRFSALDIARSVEALLSEAKKELLIGIEPVLFPHDFKPDFVFIDSLTSIASAFSGEESRFRIYIEQLFRYLEKEDITTFLIRETSHPTHLGTSFVERSEAISFLSDGILCMYNVVYSTGKRDNALEVLKMRGEGFDKKIVRFDIKKGKGIIIYPNQELRGRYVLT